MYKSPTSQAANPRSYVKPVPARIPSHKGIKINARSERDYVSSVNDRLESRHENYVRRCLQIKDQGYYAPGYRPYKGLGDPFYLEPRQLILNALGQLNSGALLKEHADCRQKCSEFRDIRELNIKLTENLNNAQDSGLSGNCDDYDQINSSDQQTINKSKNNGLSDMNNDYHQLRNDVVRLRKKLNCGRNNVFRVQVGQDFFDIVKQEIKQQEFSEKEEQLKKELEQRTTPQPAVQDDSFSDDDDFNDDDENESDYDYDNDNLSDYDENSEIEVANEQNSNKITEREYKEENESVFRSSKRNQSSLTVRNRPNSTFSRPYTPKHNNIAVTSKKLADRSALFRQLCILNWLLESMNLEPPRIARPLATCWNTYDFIPPEPGRNLRNNKTGNEYVDREWKKIILGPNFRISNRRPRYTTGSRYSTSRFLIGQRMSTRDSSILSEIMTSSRAESSMSQRDDVSIVTENEALNFDTESVRTGTSSVPPMSRRRFTVAGLMAHDQLITPMSAASRDDHVKVQDDNSDLDDERLLVPEHETNEVKLISKRTRFLNEGPVYDKELEESVPKVKARETLYQIRPESAPVLLHKFSYNMPSNRYKNLTSRMREKFTSINKEEELKLNDTLDSLDRSRLKKLENKFQKIPQNMTVNSALKIIRREQRVELQNHRAQKRPDMYQQWFLDIIQLPIGDEKDKWYFKRIFNKLGRYGQVETGKQSSYRFKKILSLLRDWEVCSPDVSAAVEFCRHHIIEMSVEEYEEWFTEAFPSVQRPPVFSQAPPALSAAPSRAPSRAGSGKLNQNNMSRSISSCS